MSYAFVFPGQGSQSLGMLSDLHDQEQVIADTFVEASACLGYDLWQIIKNGPEQELNKTEITQPAILAASIACFRLWQQKGLPMPIAMSGHSLGEYSALVCANSISFKDALLLVRDRGRFMQAAVAEGEGAMAAILGLDDETVVSICNQASDIELVSAANFNSPGQVVIAGATNAVDRAVNLAKEQGAKRALILPVSVPSHCSLMKPAADQLAERLGQIDISIPAVPVIHNVDGQTRATPEAIQQALIDQLFKSVRWVECVKTIATYSPEMVIECGPGKVLAGLIKRIDRSVKTKNLLVANDFIE